MPKKPKECDHVWQERERWHDLEYDVHNAVYVKVVIIIERCLQCGDEKQIREYDE